MPIALLMLHSALLFGACGQNPTSHQLKLVGNVTITYTTGVHDLFKDTWVFDNGVTLEYDASTVQCDHLDIDLKAQTGVAEGNVHLLDPVARVDAKRLELWWGAEGRRGHFDGAFVQVGSSRLKASSVDIAPDLWVLHDVEGTTSRAQPAWYEVHSKLLKIKPGKSGSIDHPTVYILGHKFLTLPTRSFNLDKRSEGLTIPGFNYSHQYGLGLSWGGGFLVDHSTDFAFGFGVFPNSRPGYGANLTRSLLPETRVTTFLTPQSDFGERFGYGFLDNIVVSSPESEDVTIRAERKAVSVNSVWNQVLNDRGTTAPFSKAVEAVYEQGGKMDGFGYISQVRLQTIREFGQSYSERLLLVEQVAPPPIHITPTLRTIARLDAQAFLDGYQYSWMRAIVGLAYTPVKQFRLSAGGYVSTETGSPQYEIDPLYSKAGYLVRGDLNLGPTKISFMRKRDSKLGWFDKEYSVSQVVGCFEPFITYRQNPNDYVLGFRLRLDDLTDLMTQRQFKRPPSETHVLSPDLSGNP